MLDKQIIITQHQLDVVKKDLIQVAEESADYNYQYYKDLRDLAYEARAKSFGIIKKSQGNTWTMWIRFPESQSGKSPASDTGKKIRFVL